MGGYEVDIRSYSFTAVAGSPRDPEFDPRFWYWLFEGLARVEFDRASIPTQRQLVRALLRFNPPQQLVELAARHRDADDLVFCPQWISAHCRFIITQHGAVVPVK